MRMSCNGCRVLRKGCSEDCTIRPCLQWIKNPESQGNATLFLAKFYGRAGLLNLINAGDDNHRPAIFRSLLYEACGRIVNPIYGSVGLLWSGNWQMCQAAVEAVLKGAPVIQIPSETAATTTAPMPSLKAFDIRHVAKDETQTRGGGFDLHKVAKTTRTRFKRTSVGNGSINLSAIGLPVDLDAIDQSDHSNESSSPPTPDQWENKSRFSVETVDKSTSGGDVGLELTLGSSSPTKSPSELRRSPPSETLVFSLGLHLMA